MNNVLGKKAAKCSDGFEPCTTQLSHYFVDPPAELAQEFQISGQRIVLLDTPGFDDKDHSEESEILRQIASWLKAS